MSYTCQPDVIVMSFRLNHYCSHIQVKPKVPFFHLDTSVTSNIHILQLGNFRYANVTVEKPQIYKCYKWETSDMQILQLRNFTYGNVTAEKLQIYKCYSRETSDMQMYNYH